ncbi:MAG: tetratricopeptide repeat protein [Candidatus Omnitrophica bacterium]|nr:tetratricopeptide repeat protein [Candidatus Omnitrophota bacterium]
MKEKLKLIGFLLILAMLLPAGLVRAGAEDLEGTIKQYISELKENPGNDVIREKIIRLARTLTPAPIIPEEAREHFIMAEGLQRSAKGRESYQVAINEYKAALLIAPWWQEAYRKLGKLQKLTGEYNEAIRTFNLYLLTNPDDAKAVQKEIHDLKAAGTINRSKIKTRSGVPKFEGHWYMIAPQGGSLIKDYIVIGRTDGGELFADRSDHIGEVFYLEIEARRIMVYSKSDEYSYKLDLTLSKDDNKMEGKLQRTLPEEAPETFPITLYRQ